MAALVPLLHRGITSSRPLESPADRRLNIKSVELLLVEDQHGQPTVASTIRRTILESLMQAGQQSLKQLRMTPWAAAWGLGDKPAEAGDLQPFVAAASLPA